jgi:hypothetical protein
MNVIYINFTSERVKYLESLVASKSNTGCMVAATYIHTSKLFALPPATGRDQTN